MSVRITDTVTADGRKFQQMLKELAEKEVRVGFQHGKATEEDGTDICDIAAWNELGTVHIPAPQGDRDFSERPHPREDYGRQFRTKCGIDCQEERLIQTAD